PAISQLKRAMELNPRDSEAAYNLSMLLLQHASSLKRTAARDIGQRKSLDALAKFYRTDALKWYQTAVKNGAQADPSLEKALKEE
ncbi:MAG: hypothetical protein J6S21_06700, partial [Victivallales bacterium]|nr:hypothetical protein [Victivallales bacterium]